MINNANLSCSNISGATSNLCTITSGGGGGGANVSTTTCSGTDKVSAINNVTGAVTCSADQTGSSSGITIESLFSRGSYYKMYDFESVTAGYTTLWVPTAISSGTSALETVTTLNYSAHPGVARVLSSTTASSGYAYQITGASTYRLDQGYYTSLVVMPNNKTINYTEIRFGFQDVFTSGAVTDGVFINISQVSSGTWNMFGIARNNSVQTKTTTNYSSTGNSTWYAMDIYIYSPTNATFRIFSESGTLLWTDSVATNIPTTAGRETSHGIVAYAVGGTTAQILALYDVVTIGINKTITR
jgi:hypothetical protein